MAHHTESDSPAFRRRTLLTGSMTMAGLVGLGLLPPRQGRGWLGAVSANATPQVLEPTKSKPTFYTSQRVAAIRANVATYPWARALRDEAVAAAEELLSHGDDWIWNLVTTQALPRANYVNEQLGSPISGRDIYEFGTYPWRADPLRMPWKIVDPAVDPASGLPTTFPTNDFAAYYRSGLDQHGNFDPDLADRSLLVNELYPELGPTWGVDDGYGWVDEEGNRWTFVAYYNHWCQWLNELGGHGLVGRGVKAFRDAFLYTGDLRYAHAGLILLDRIADVYPTLHLDPFPAEWNRNGHGGTGKGKAVGSIWESWMAKDYCLAYDAFFPAIARRDEAEVVDFLRTKAEQYDLAAKDSVEAIRVNIENGILRTIYPAVQAAEIRGNFGMHQSALAMAAVVLGKSAETAEWKEFLFKTGDLVRDPEWRVTGGNVASALIDDVDHDGCGTEGSLAYNRIWMLQIRDVADVLVVDEDDNLYQHPKVEKLFECMYPFTMLNAYVPSIGDTGRTGAPDLFLNARDYVRAFEQYPTREFAQMACLLNGGTADGLYGDVSSLDVAGTVRRIQEIVDRDGPLNLPSVNLTGFGFAALRAGTGTGRRELWVYYGRNYNHGHADTLNLGMYAGGVDLLPDLGYPEFLGNNARRLEWNSNTIAHNTVVVDAQTQEQQDIGRALGFAVGERAQYLSVAAPKVYSQTSLYQRSCVLVDVDPDRCYAVDVFRVAGGRDHHYSFHAAEGPVTVHGLALTPQPTGTYAGPDVYPPDDFAPARPRASGFDWLFDVERDTEPTVPFSVDWSIQDTWNVHEVDPDLHLRLTMLSPVDDVALADGIPPRNKEGNPESLRYLIAHRHGVDLTSQFVSVIEPYIGTSTIADARTVDVEVLDGGALASHEAVAVRVELTDGRVDYVVCTVRPDLTLLVDGTYVTSGELCVWSLRNRRPEYGLLYNGTRLSAVPGIRSGPAAVTGTVTAFTTELSNDNSITLALDEPVPADVTLVGSSIYVENDGTTNAVYRITDAFLGDQGALTVGIGNVSPIRGHVAPENPDLGFQYDLAVGAAARIPLTREWRGRGRDRNPR
ncbi:heparinase II/III domain-containing protein [Thermasporomyces composti]|uniref:Heparinase II/III-like protein n=1 Tax=Thermasporomyces composti TaxID=696763 RepID=A0A3D9VIM3_THECX|nr:heparinase II/III family protein [Thermasporomyces composti]REF37161.1 heparinase II/III-like protein [Thermasporomyces composti]